MTNSLNRSVVYHFNKALDGTFPVNVSVFGYPWPTDRAGWKIQVKDNDGNIVEYDLGSYSDLELQSQPWYPTEGFTSNIGYHWDDLPSHLAWFKIIDPFGGTLTSSFLADSSVWDPNVDDPNFFRYESASSIYPEPPKPPAPPLPQLLVKAKIVKYDNTPGQIDNLTIGFPDIPWPTDRTGYRVTFTTNIYGADDPSGVEISYDLGSFSDDEWAVAIDENQASLFEAGYVGMGIFGGIDVLGGTFAFYGPNGYKASVTFTPSQFNFPDSVLGYWSDYKVLGTLITHTAPTTNTSILNDIKKALNISQDYPAFDQEILMHINSVFGTLNQLGIGPEDGFEIVDSSKTWNDYLMADKRYSPVRSYIYLRVRLLFDPPTISYVLTSMENQSKELEWRINVMREDLVHPISDNVVIDDGVVLDGGHA